MSSSTGGRYDDSDVDGADSTSATVSTHAWLAPTPGAVVHVMFVCAADTLHRRPDYGSTPAGAGSAPAASDQC